MPPAGQVDNPAMATRPPRVVVDLEKLRHINCGLGRFSLHLAESLLTASAGRIEPVFFLAPESMPHLPAGGYTSLAVSPWKKEGVYGLIRPLVRPFLPVPDIALWHVTNQMSKYLPLDPRIPVVLTIHDLTFLHEGSARRADENRRKLAAIQRRIDRSAAIVTDTQFVADDVARHLDIGSRPLSVVPLGIPPTVAASANRPVFLTDGPFLLALGNCLPHKNFHALIDMADHAPDLRIVIAGKKATPYGQSLDRQISRRGLGDRVVLPGEVSDADRQWLYEHCEGLLFPSLTEGFGLPVLEAMQCGKPVFLSRLTCLPEIAGDLGFYFESFEPQRMAAQCREGLGRVRLDPTYADRARDHAARFSWAAAAENYLRIYESVLGR